MIIVHRVWVLVKCFLHEWFTLLALSLCTTWPTSFVLFFLISVILFVIQGTLHLSVRYHHFCPCSQEVTSFVYLLVSATFYIKLATVVEGDSKASFSIATTPRCREGATPFPGLLHFTLGTYLIMLSVKQGGIKYQFKKSLSYNSTWDWTPVSRLAIWIFFFIIYIPLLSIYFFLYLCIAVLDRGYAIYWRLAFLFTYISIKSLDIHKSCFRLLNSTSSSVTL